MYTIKVLGLSIALAALLTLACKPGEAITSQPVNPENIFLQKDQGDGSAFSGSWEIRWDRALSEAKKEGKVVIYSGLGPPTRRALSEAFKKKYGLEIEWTPGSGSDISQKLVSERRAGLFLADLFAVGSSIPVVELKPQGVLDPVEKELLLPEVLDSNKWLDNKLPWVDREHYIIAPALSPASTLLINPEKVKSSEIVSYNDLLQSKWRGKISMLNPTRPGSSAKWLSVIGLRVMGWDFIKELVKQEINIAGDKRLATEWTVRGKTDVTIAPAGEIVDEFLKAGARLELLAPKEGTYQTGGSSVLSLINKRPHPNAARIFVNWYLSQEGQQIFADFDMRQGARLDLNFTHLPPTKIRQPGLNYIHVEDEDFLREESEAIKTIREIFSPYQK